MDADLAALPNDIDALKAALTIERAKTREMAAERDAGAAELAVARAKAAADLAMIAHQALRRPHVSCDGYAELIAWGSFRRFQCHGSSRSSSWRLICPDTMRLSTSVSQASGSTPLSLAVWINVATIDQ
jgi:hypothetical protein